MKLLTSTAFIAASVFGGLLLSHLPDFIPCGNVIDVFPCSNMPYPIDRFIRSCLSIVGRGDLANPDDMETLAALLYWAIATVLVGMMISIGNRAFARHRARKGSGP